MKFLKYFFLLSILIATSFSTAQTVGKQLEFNSAWGVDYESNMVKNPSAAKNLNDTLKLGATLSRDTSSGNKIDGKASFLLDASALNDYLELDLHTPNDEQTSGNCGFKGLFKGDARLYRAQILDGSSNVLAQTVPLTNETGFREFRVWYPCGASGARKVRITQTEAGTAPAINVGKFYYGRMEPGAGTSPNTFSAKVSATGVVSDETPSDWINGNFSISSSVDFNGTFVSGKFNVAPNCVATVNTVSGSAGTQTIRTFNVTTSTFGVTSVHTNATTPAAFTLICTKTGSDYVQPAITPDTPRFPTVQRFTSGSGTYTTPVGVKYIRVRMVGGGGGGGGSGTTSGTASQSGGNTTFGSSLLIANGGSGGNRASTTAAGGSVTINSPALSIVSISGGNGQGANIQNSSNTNATPLLNGGNGGSSLFGGNGAGSRYDNPGGNAVSNSGGGGGGAGCDSSNNNQTGSGGGAGGYIEAIIVNPSSSYSYSVGSGGNGQGAGTAGQAGGSGGSGIIIVEEYYGTENTPLLLNTVYADTAVKAEKSAGVTSVDYGTWTPTVSAIINASAVTPASCSYMRIGNVVNASCNMSVTCTTIGTPYEYKITLPNSSIVLASASGSVGSIFEGENGRVISLDSDKVLIQSACKYNSTNSNRTINFMYRTN